MANDIPKIEDLLEKTGADSTDTEGDGVQEKFEEKMHDIRLKEKEEAAEAEAKQKGFPYVNLKGFPISPEALQEIPLERAKELNTVCFLYTGPEIRLASTNPDKQEVEDLLFALEERNKANGKLYKISDESLRVALKAYETLPQVKEVKKGVKITQDELDEYQKRMDNYGDIERMVEDAGTTDTITILIAAALKFGTSDIHVEAEKESIAVRFRIDGVLQDITELDDEDWKKISSRIKLISGLKINVTDRPQDGRFTIFLEEGNTDVRVSTIPTNWGESIVMRILKPTAIQVDFGDLGWRKEAEKKLRAEIEKPNGMIVTTGPTGSGKTTTLYSILRERNEPEVKIITLEDPIEYKLKGIQQSQIQRDKEYTFAKGLRSILRQDPDIVMVGEIRDLETAEVSINAALTGHLLISTLHTNDAAGALPRFISMGVKPFLLSPALNAIIGQRLTRRVHDACEEEYTPDDKKLSALKKVIKNIPDQAKADVPPEDEWEFRRGKGCEECNGTGYKGRVGIFEILLMDENIQEALSENISEYEVRQLAKKQGMVTMQQDGMLKVLDGVTTIDEVLRVAGEGV
jgi:type IV pilus assembly protein PilB